jgi:hypothetical protein
MAPLSDCLWLCQHAVFGTVIVKGGVDTYRNAIAAPLSLNAIRRALGITEAAVGKFVPRCSVIQFALANCALDGVEMCELTCRGRRCVRWGDQMVRIGRWCVLNGCL